MMFVTPLDVTIIILYSCAVYVQNESVEFIDRGDKNGNIRISFVHAILQSGSKRNIIIGIQNLNF